MHRRAFLALFGLTGAAVAVARVPFLRAEEGKVFVRAWWSGGANGCWVIASQGNNG